MRFSEEELEGMSALRAMRNRVTDVIATRPCAISSTSPAVGGRQALVGSAKDIADQLKQWFVERVCDGLSSWRPTFPAHLRISSAW